MEFCFYWLTHGHLRYPTWHICFSNVSRVQCLYSAIESIAGLTMPEPRLVLMLFALGQATLISWWHARLPFRIRCFRLAAQDALPKRRRQIAEDQRGLSGAPQLQQGPPTQNSPKYIKTPNIRSHCKVGGHGGEGLGSWAAFGRALINHMKRCRTRAKSKAALFGKQGRKPVR